MRVLFVTRPHLPRIGGAQLTTHAVALGLARRGHDVTVLYDAEEPLAGGEPPAGLDPRSFPYEVRRSPDPAHDVPGALRELGPDIVVVEDRGHKTWIPRGILRAVRDTPTVMHVQMAGSEGIVAEPGARPDAVVVVSQYLAGLVRACGRRDVVVVHPAIDAAALRPPVRRRVALLVNPAAHKGLAVVLALARARPDVRFAVVRTFHPLERLHLARVAERLSEVANLEVRPPTNDPVELYGDTRVMLIPSLRPEGFGRVAAEADVCGIPVIASRTGGMEEAAGRTALLLAPGAGIAAWERALAAIWDDPAEYARRASPADRPELQPEVVAATWEHHLAAVVARRVAA